MTDADFIEAICRDPNDQAVRAAFHDFLEEQGDPRAAFIRVQCQIENMKAMDDPRTPLRSEHPAHEEWKALRRREQVLMDLLGYPVPSAINPQRKRFLWETRSFLPTYRRGFVEKITCCLTDWIGEECESCHGTGRIKANGPAIVKANPIRTIEISDWQGGQRAGAYWPPIAHFNHYRKQDRTHGWLAWGFDPANNAWYEEFTTEAAAREALSKGLLNWARHVAFAASPP